MMMPANFSAISENEMTYVNGGASLSASTTIAATMPLSVTAPTPG